MLKESTSEREVRLELAQRKTSKPEQVKVLIDNVILAIKLNASMLYMYVHEINDRIAKYINLPESWQKLRMRICGIHKHCCQSANFK